MERKRLPASVRGGPVTKAGKAIVSQNAIKHGLNSNLLLRHESRAEFEQHEQAVMEELQPATYLEAQCVREIVMLLWRRQRLTAYETAYLKFRDKTRRHHAEQDANPRPLGDDPFAMPPPVPTAEELRDLSGVPDAGGLDKAIRYGAFICRRLDRELKRLRDLQDLRRRAKKIERRKKQRPMVVLFNGQHPETNHPAKQVVSIPRKALPSPHKNVAAAIIQEIPTVSPEKKQ